MKCTSTCTVIRQLDGEVYCLTAHGTVLFVKQPWDLMENSLEDIEQDPETVYRMMTTGVLTLSELARELGYSHGSAVLNRVKRWQRNKSKTELKDPSSASLVNLPINS